MAATEKPQVDVPSDQSPSYQLELEDISVGEGEEAVADALREQVQRVRAYAEEALLSMGNDVLVEQHLDAILRIGDDQSGQTVTLCTTHNRWPCVECDYAKGEPE